MLHNLIFMKRIIIYFHTKYFLFFLFPTLKPQVPSFLVQSPVPFQQQFPEKKINKNNVKII